MSTIRNVYYSEKMLENASQTTNLRKSTPPAGFKQGQEASGKKTLQTRHDAFNYINQFVEQLKDIEGRENSFWYDKKKKEEYIENIKEIKKYIYEKSNALLNSYKCENLGENIQKDKASISKFADELGSIKANIAGMKVLIKQAESASSFSKFFSRIFK